MEPVKGGNLASYAIRFAAMQEGMMSVLSGMSTLEQVKDNVSYMKDFKPLDKKELEVVEVFHKMSLIPCTACRCCVAGYPKNILIPDLFVTMNAKKIHNNWNPDFYYHNVHTVHHGKVSDCIKCGKWEKN